ncbi:MAG TPA: 6-phosphofructokinase [Thermoanaerobaculia bacterium]|nr:6-phosphofructokinase [Thermoanaerobaculia bacterium]
MAGKHIGILTGGGDVPGLNAAIKAVYHAVKAHGWIRSGSADANLTGILRGWKGCVSMRPDRESGGWSDVVLLTDERVRTVDRYGGTFLHTSRTKPDRIRASELPGGWRERAGDLPRAGAEHVDATDLVIRNLRELKIDCLIAIGGDDTLGYAHTLNDRGFPVVGIPKTMDNDVRGTEYCLGFATAINRALAFINRQRTHLGSHEVVGVFRIFGRDSGFTAMGTAMAISDLRCAIPEHRFELEDLCDLLARDHAGHPSHYAMVVCSEGAIWKGGTLEDVGPADAFGHRHKQNVGEALAEEVTRRTGLPARTQDLTHDLRSGDPDPLDRIIANTYGTLAVELVAREETGQMVCIQEGVYRHTVLPAGTAAPRTIDVETDYDVRTFRPRFETRFDRPVFF